MKNISPQKSNSLTIDICKFLGAYMVVAIHTTPWNLFGTGAFNTVYLNFIYCAVPCFFMASGYLLAGRMEWPLTAKDNLPKVAHAFFKMLKLYLLWSLAYLPLAIFDYRRSGLGVREAAIRYIKGLVFSGEHYGSWMLFNISGCFCAASFLCFYHIGTAAAEKIFGCSVERICNPLNHFHIGGLPISQLIILNCPRSNTGFPRKLNLCESGLQPFFFQSVFEHRRHLFLKFSVNTNTFSSIRIDAK